ncbi:ankyrin repeat domain-containing protein 50-like [Artemia franciscana]|uniref:ankyrin repeat domain-containing protein 50-like n=1 Tax=Artemia franciscana TaxID=6661 RepID=UPI0032DACB10
MSIRSLYLAASKGCTQVVEHLLKLIYCFYGETPLHLAAWRGHTRTVEYLLQAGADINVKNENGESLLHFAALNGNTRTVECLLKFGADVNIRNNYGNTPLYLAVSERHTETVECLIQSGADLNIKNEEGESPLQFAAEQGHTETVEYLIQSGADVNIENLEGESPLHFAAVEGHTETVEYLIQSGADVNVKNEDGASPLHLSCSTGSYMSQTCILIHKSQTCECLLKYVAAWKGHTQTVECLLKHGAYVNSKDEGGRTALHYACWSGDKECVGNLLEHGSDIDITDRNDRTAFDIAVDDTAVYFSYDFAVYFASHILKLRVANLYVSERNIRLSDKTQTSYPANELKDQFVRELQQMRSETIFCNITFYDIFIKGISSIELYTMNENSLKGLLKSSNWETKFSMYNTPFMYKKLFQKQHRKESTS